MDEPSELVRAVSHKMRRVQCHINLINVQVDDEDEESEEEVRANAKRVSQWIDDVLTCAPRHGSSPALPLSSKSRHATDLASNETNTLTATATNFSFRSIDD